MSATAPPVLWRAKQVSDSAFGRFAAENGLEPDYAEVHRWSIEDLDRFWRAVARFVDVQWGSEAPCALADATMPHASWFPGATVSYPAHVFRDRNDDGVAIHEQSEVRGYGTWTWGQLRAEAARIATALRALGVGKGDRVAAYLPNVPETVAAFLATTSLGAVWSSAAPEFGAEAVVARFAQIEPKVIFTVDGYRYRGKDIPRDEEGRQIAERIGARQVRLGYLDGTGWDSAVAGVEPEPLNFELVEFDHPLWILYSSGTTGTPKAIVHGHGGVLIEHLKTAIIQEELTPDDRFFWFTTTGWMMWNFLVSGLLAGSQIVVFDGDPSGEVLWDLAEQAGVTVFGASAGYLQNCMNDGQKPADGRDLSALRAIGSTGAPLDPRCFDWVYEVLGDDIWLFSPSGGTDVATAFLGTALAFPVYRGELGAAALGVDLQSYAPDGTPRIGEVGEMVITQPMPSMPIYFWNDPYDTRLLASYYEQFPGVWTHGDWLELTERGTGIIQGRSDATINRGGVRIGTSELYDVVLRLPQITDALAVDVPVDGGSGRLLMFVTLAEDATGEEVRDLVRTTIRSEVSPRHVPDDVVVVSGIPRTSSGKRIEIPIKRVLMGADPDSVLDRSSLADPRCLEDFERFAAQATGTTREERA